MLPRQAVRDPAKLRQRYHHTSGCLIRVDIGAWLGFGGLCFDRLNVGLGVTYRFLKYLYNTVSIVNRSCLCSCLCSVYEELDNIILSAHTVYVCVLCGSENKQRIFPCTALTDWFL